MNPIRRTWDVLSGHSSHPFSARTALGLMVVLFLATTVLASSAGAARISVRLTPDTFTTESPALLEITIADEQAKPVLPEVDGLLFQRHGQSKRYLMVNGAVTASRTYTYLVQATRPGKYLIPPITAGGRGNLLKTDPLSCTVIQTDGEQPVTAPPAADEDAARSAVFLEMVPHRQETYVNETAPVTIKVYIRFGTRADISTLPRLLGDSVLLHPPSGRPRKHTTSVAGVPYTVISWDAALTGIKEGYHALILEADIQLLVRARRQRESSGPEGRLLDDRLFNTTFGNVEHQVTVATSSPVGYFVKPLPRLGRPEGFSGAIGTFTLRGEVRPLILDHGDPVTIIATITGVGNFSTVAPPRFRNTKGLKTYEPTIRQQPEVSSYRGDKVFEQAVVITDASLSRIPSLVFSFFDPERRTYQTLETAPVPLTVNAPSADKAMDAASTIRRESAEASQTLTQRLTLLPEKRDAARRSSRALLLARPWMITGLLVGLSGLVIAFILIIRKARRRQQDQQGHRVSHTLRQQRRETLQALEQAGLLKGEDYLSAARKLAAQYFGWRWKNNGAALTTSDIRRRLGADSPVTQLFTLTDRCSYGRTHLDPRQRQDIHKALVSFIKRYR